MPRWPVDSPRATPHGKWGTWREDGPCGLKAPPCLHNAIDLAAPKGTEVYAPEDCSVDSVSTGTMPPFRGYGPGMILMRGLKTGVYHLLAHLDPATIPSPTVPGGFWDYATRPIFSDHSNRRQIKEGELVGLTSAKNHVHWETRSPGWNGARNNPALWVKRYVSPGLDLSQFSTSGGGDDGDLLLLLGLAYIISES